MRAFYLKLIEPASFRFHFTPAQDMRLFRSRQFGDLSAACALSLSRSRNLCPSLYYYYYYSPMNNPLKLFYQQVHLAVNRLPKIETMRRQVRASRAERTHCTGTPVVLSVIWKRERGNGKHHRHTCVPTGFPFYTTVCFLHSNFTELECFADAEKPLT